MPPASPTNIAHALGQAAGQCTFASPVHHVYNPLDYAFAAHRQYLQLHCNVEAGILLVGMNPGPFGMVQTGVPFGEVSAVRDWLGIAGGIKPPRSQHPKRPVEGFSCTRSEVSGQRLWGWARERFGTADVFFRQFFVWNYCPLAFLEASGRNRTPNKLPQHERAPLYRACDQALSDIVDFLQPDLILGIGRFGEQRARAILGDAVRIGHVLHPSPASPAANRGWAQQVERQLADLDVELPDG